MLRRALSWTTISPLAAALILALTWGTYPGPVLAGIAAIALAASVLAAVHHAEVVAHRVGEPFGSLILALAVTVIEVGMIIMMMSGGKAGTEGLARDTVFAAVMVTTNLIAGLAIFVAAGKGTLAHFNAEGSGTALATALVLATTTMVLPTVTTTGPAQAFTTSQSIFVAVVALVLWGLFVLTQTTRHRDFFLPVDHEGNVISVSEHAEPPTARETGMSVGLLLLSLVAVVGLAKVLSPSIEAAVKDAGLPEAFVGLVIALLVLLPETIAAYRNARQGRTQIALNLAYGSAIASIGLTIPVVAILALVLKLNLLLGLTPLHIALLALTGIVGALTVVPGRATRMNGVLHLVIAASFIFLTAVP